MDFWVFPEFRGNGTGHACFYALEEYTKKEGALYYELNSEKENAMRKHFGKKTLYFYTTTLCSKIKDL